MERIKKRIHDSDNENKVEQTIGKKERKGGKKEGKGRKERRKREKKGMGVKHNKLIIPIVIIIIIKHPIIISMDT